MKRSRRLWVLEFTLLLVSGAAATLLPTSPFTPQALVWFVAALSILKLSDVWLPRGDSVGMSSALALGALLLFDARVVLIALVVAELIALIPAGRAQKLTAAATALTAEVVAAVVCSAALVPLRLHPHTHVLVVAGRGLYADEYVALLAVGLLFAALEFGLTQLLTGVRDIRPIRSSILGSVSYGGWLIGAQASAGVLAALMYRTMGPWGLVVAVVIILVMRQSFVLLLEIRGAYNSTIDVLIRAMEAQRPGREGVAERNADLATRVGRTIGLHGRELERLRYAALLAGLGDPDESDETALGPSLSSRASSRVVEKVEFLSAVLPVLRLYDSPSSGEHVRRGDTICAYTVMAVGQATGTVTAAQLRELSERVSPRVTAEVDAALASVLASREAAEKPS